MARCDICRVTEVVYPANSCDPCARRIRERAQVQIEHTRFRVALEEIAKCNDGKGHMPSVARRALGWSLLP